MAQVVTASDFDTEVLQNSGVVLVDFYADWCGPCQALLPIIDELANEVGEGAKVVKVNVDESSELAGTYGVMSIPTLKLFKGGEVVDEATGVQPKEKLLEMVNKHK